ncbi:MAG: zinc metalloprotease [Planctomycetota bacterium]
MRHNQTSGFGSFSFLFIVLMVAVMVFSPGCSKKHKSDRDSAPVGSLPSSNGGGGGYTGSGGGGNAGGAFGHDLACIINGSPSQAQKEYVAGRLKTYNDCLWIGTEGQAYLNNLTLTAASGSTADVIFKSADGGKGNPAAWCQTSSAGWWKIHLTTGNCEGHTFNHEIGHGWVGPWSGSEEYNCRSGDVCSQGAGGGAAGEGRIRWCDPSNCVANQQCWNKMQQTHGWAHPGPGGQSPTCNVTIQ